VVAPGLILFGLNKIKRKNGNRSSKVQYGM